MNGGKQYLASRIVALMPPHLHFCEPFAGGLAVLLAKDPDGVSEVVNDIHAELTNFWIVLRAPEMFEQFRRAVEATPFSEPEWRYQQQWCDLPPEAGIDPVRRALAFFIVCRQSIAGRMDSFAPLSRNRVRRGMNEQASAWLNAVEGLPAVHARLKRVVIVGPKDALEVIRQQDGPQTLFYADPPYMHETRATTDDYAHEMTVEQHAALLDVLAGIKGKFLLSGYHSAMYDAAAKKHGWQWRGFDLPNNAAGGESKRRMTEVCWANYPLPEVQA